MPVPSGMFDIDRPFAEAFAFCLLVIVAALGIDCAVHREHAAPVPILQKVCTSYPNGVVVCNCKYGTSEWGKCK
jgi:hypothetical protein